MKLAIHHRDTSFSPHWVEYCKKNRIDYKVVNCYDSDIIEQLKDCDGLLYNWVHWHSRDLLLAKQLIYSVERMGLKVYPNSNTSQYFDDKLGQKYLFEALDVPAVNSFAFYYKKDALKWLKKAQLPLVFKLRGGAGSVNVKLVKTKREAKDLINKSFSKGFLRFNRWSSFNDRIYKCRKSPSVGNFVNTLKGAVRIVMPDEHRKMMTKERGYVYFQEFITGNEFDIRVTVVGDKAFCIKRMVRDDDFRASGSGDFIFDPEVIGQEYIDLAFKINEKLKMQCVCFDFIKKDGEIKVVEISYNFVLLKWPGYWVKDRGFVQTDFNATHLIIENFIKEIEADR